MSLMSALVRIYVRNVFLQAGSFCKGLPRCRVRVRVHFMNSPLKDPVKHFYRTHVHMGSDHWVALSVTNSNTFLKPCEDLVKTVNVVNVVKI